MVIIICIILIVLCVAISWSLHNLRQFEKVDRIKIASILFLIIIILTSITFNISKTDIIYPNEDIEKTNSRVLILEYIGINTLIIMPIITKKIAKIKNREISKEKFGKIIVISFIILICILIYECKNMYISQENIVNKYNELVNENNN